MREITVKHRMQGYGYLLTIQGVQETILMGAEDLLFLGEWCATHRQELEQEDKEEHGERARRLLDQG